MRSSISPLGSMRNWADYFTLIPMESNTHKVKKRKHCSQRMSDPERTTKIRSQAFASFTLVRKDVVHFLIPVASCKH